MEEGTGFPGISSAAWRVIGIVLPVALVVIAYLSDVAPGTA